MRARVSASLRARLLSFLVVLFAVLFGAIALYRAIVLEHDREESAERAMNVAREFAHAYEVQVGEVQRLLEVIAAGPTESLRPTGCETYLARVRSRYPQLRNLMWADADGTVQCAAAASGAPVNIGGRPGLRRARESKTFVVSSAHRSPISGNVVVVAILPVVDGAGETSRFLTATIDLDSISRKFAEKLAPEMVVRLMDEEGTILVRQPNPECCVGRSGLELPGIRKVLAAGESQVITSAIWLDGVERLQADVALRTPAAGVLSVGIPPTVIGAPANQILITGLTGLLVLLAAAAAIAWFGVEALVLRPIYRLSETLGRVRSGNSDGRIAPDKGADELAELAVGVNDMAQTLAQRQARLLVAAEVLDQAREGIIIADADVKIVTVNRSFTAVTGYAAAEVIGRNPRFLQLGRSESGFYREMWEAVNREGFWSGEIWNRRKDGSTYLAWLSVTRLSNTSGEVTNYVGIFTDLTPRRQAEMALRQSEERLSTLIEAAPDAIFFKDGDGRWLVTNTAARALFNAENIPWQGKDELELARLQPELRDAHLACRESDEAAWTAKALTHSVESFHDENGGRREFDVSRMPLYDTAGNRRAMVVIGRDATERKQHEHELLRLNEELEQRVASRTLALEAVNRELESFSYSVAHDLRSPLRAIDGFSRILEEECAGQLDERARSHLQRVHAGVDRMSNLIDDLLELARLARQPLHVESIDLSALAREIAEELQAGQPGHPTEWVIAPEARAMGDRDLLRIALVNLLGNAWKYSSKRERARIKFGVAEDNGRPAYFVRDNGAGFDMAHAGKLFSAFHRLHTPADFPGTGIGLAIVARIVHRHHGKVWAESRVNEGATFYFTL